MADKWHDIIVRMDAKLDVLNSRMDRHAQANEERFSSVKEEFEEVNKKLDGMNEKIHANEITVIKETGATNTKIAGISGTVAILSAILINWIKSKVVGP